MANEVTKDTLSRNESAVLYGLVAGMTIPEIATSAGLHEITCYKLAAAPHVRRALHEHQATMLKDLATKAIRVLQGILDGPEATLAEKRLKADVAKIVFDRAGHAAGVADGQAGQGQRLSDMSIEDIERALQDAKRKAADGAKVLDLTADDAQDSAQQDSQVIDILD